MPKYFTHLSHTNNPTNQLHRDARAVLEASSNLLIDDVEIFVAELKAEIEQLNIRHPRTTPLRVTAHNYFTDTTHVYLGDRFTVSFSIYPVKNQFTKENAGDLSFLREISQAIDKGDLEQVNTLVGDWIDELEKKEAQNA